MRCREFVGRVEELAMLERALEDASRRRGSWVSVLGEAGIGKTRLSAEFADLAKARGGRVAVGRCSPVDRSTPYRMLSEALIDATRGRTRPDDERVVPYIPAVATLVPHWRETLAVLTTQSPAIVGESVVRVLDWLAGGRPMLVVFEDLHWADAGTLAVCDYVIDHLDGTGLLIVATARDAEAPADTMAVLRRARTLRLPPLSPGEVTDLAERCLGSEVPAETIERLHRQASGLPLLVEDLLSADGASRFEDLIRSRLQSLPRRSQQAVVAAALIGERFDWRRLVAALQFTDEATVDALSGAMSAQLVVRDGEQFRFRHALTRDAVLASAPALARGLATRVARSLETSGDEDDLARAAELWVDADFSDRAADLLVRAADVAIRRGSPATAIELLGRAADLAPEGPIRARIALARLAHLVSHGRAEEAISVGMRLLDTSTDTDSVRRWLARALLDAGRADEASRHLHAMPNSAERLVLSARATLAGGGADRRIAAEHLAHQALAARDIDHQPAVACEALETIALCARSRSLADAEAALQRSLAIAESSGLTSWRLRVLNELGTVEMLRLADGARLARAHEQALRSGALDLAIGIEVNTAALHAMRGELDEANDVARRAEADARRLGLNPLAAAAIVMQALSHGFRGQREAMERRLRAAEALSPADADLRAFADGAGRGLCALLREERDEAIGSFRRAIQPHPPIGALDTAHGPLLLTLAASGRATPADLSAARATATPGAGWSDLWLGYGEAALERSEARFEAADTAARRHPLFRAIGLRLLSEAALRDGWGTPVAWLREAEAVFVTGGQDRIAAACRGLMKQAGVTVARRRGPDRALPPELVRLGVTAREAEVLDLVAERLGNKEIATRLFLSPRTVEKHVASLLTKLGATDRSALVAIARR